MKIVREKKLQEEIIRKLNYSCGQRKANMIYKLRLILFRPAMVDINQ
jgi:hypothetical protein